MTELDQILIPSEGDEYETWNLLTLFGIDRNILQSYSGFGPAPLHFITQRGPFQDGQTVLDYRYDPRVSQIVIEESLICRVGFWDRKWKWLDFLRPGRSFGATTRPLIYRKWLPDGKIESGTDMTTTNASFNVTSHDGRFIENGLDAGVHIVINGVTYTVATVPNDYTLTLTIVYAGATDTNVAWHYRRGWGKRDLYCLVEGGPNFDESADNEQYAPAGYREVVRLVSHDPFWYGEEQTETWSIEALDALIFDTDSTSAVRSWFGESPGIGFWFFAGDSVSDYVEVVYWGTRAAKPVIEITGPAGDPVIENTTIGVRIEMDYTIAVGETVTINTLAQTVTNNFGDNLMPYTTGDVVTFELSPAPQAPNRVNIVYVSFGGGVTGESAVTMKWRNRHVGLI